MSQFLIPLSYWLHSLATVVFIGHFVLLATIYLPALSKDNPALSDVSKRSRPWMYASLGIFFITGVYLTLVDPNYQGLGNFGNFWAVMMLVKHILILVMLIMGFWFNALLRVGPSLRSNPEDRNFRRYVHWMAICGVLVLLLTALAQVK